MLQIPFTILVLVVSVILFAFAFPNIAPAPLLNAVLFATFFWPLGLGLIVVVGLSLYIAMGAAGRWRNPATGIVAIAVLALLLTGDEFLGRQMLDYLCLRNSDFRVYRSIDLPAQFWNERGVILPQRSPNEHGENALRIGDCCYQQTLTTPYYGWLNLDKRTMQVKTLTNDEIVSERDEFALRRGWLAKTLGLDHGSAESCSRPPDWDDLFYRMTFNKTE